MGEVVWAPWRMAYIMSEKEAGCIFCDKPRQQRDAENYILWRGDTAFVMLNSYPYNNGHLMIIPQAHVASLTQLTPPQANELMALTAISEGILQRALQPHGFNIGLNLGTAAGAGIADHLHMHVVPRWAGDTNYMTVVSNVRVIPQLLDDTYQTLAAHFQALPHNSPRP